MNSLQWVCSHRAGSPVKASVCHLTSEIFNPAVLFIFSSSTRAWKMHVAHMARQAELAQRPSCPLTLLWAAETGRCSSTCGGWPLTVMLLGVRKWLRDAEELTRIQNVSQIYAPHIVKLDKCTSFIANINDPLWPTIEQVRQSFTFLHAVVPFLEHFNLLSIHTTFVAQILLLYM